MELRDETLIPLELKEEKHAEALARLGARKGRNSAEFFLLFLTDAVNPRQDKTEALIFLKLKEEMQAEALKRNLQFFN